MTAVPDTVWDFSEPLDWPQVERLAQALAQLQAELDVLSPGAQAWPEHELEALAQQLQALKLGGLPFALPPPLREAVGAVEEMWASETGAQALKSRLGRFLAPLEQRQAELKQEEAALALAEERLATLKLLADLLDELLKTQVAAPSEEPRTVPPAAALEVIDEL